MLCATEQCRSAEGYSENRRSNSMAHMIRKVHKCVYILAMVMSENHILRLGGKDGPGFENDGRCQRLPG